jgi:hypothetical protein
LEPPLPDLDPFEPPPPDLAPPPDEPPFRPRDDDPSSLSMRANALAAIPALVVAVVLVDAFTFENVVAASLKRKAPKEEEGRGWWLLWIG